MSEFELNPDQKRAVDFPHDKPAVVTAAAGSGKTTLLVDRVVRLLSDRTLEIRADRLGIMTFTRNATKSLREKLNHKLAEKIEQLSCENTEEAAEERAYLNEQIFALRQASISTIDAFCLKIIRENPEAFDLPINFTISDPAKKTALQSQALKLAMQDFYNDSLTGDHAFSEDERRTLFYTFGFEDDSALKKSLIDTAEELSSYADAEGWLSGAESVYGSVESLMSKYLPFAVKKVGALIENARNIIDVYEDVRENLIPESQSIIANTKTKSTIANHNDLIEKTAPQIFAYIDEDKRRFETLERSFAELKPELDPAEKFITAVRAIPPNSVAAETSGGARNPYKTSFNTAKKAFQGIIDGVIEDFADRAAEEETFPEQQTAALSFIRLLRVYREYLEQAKKNSGCVDFSDCELFLLEKLRTDESFRRQLSERFCCIIVDEFQDSNDIQAEIFRLLGCGRLFYVGDVKQSIYAFRGGNPSIMAGLKANEGFEELPLNTNYRSRRSVIDTVNAAFSGLMTPEYGGVDYADGHELSLGARYPEIPEEHRKKYSSEVILLNTKENSDDDKDMTGARFVAARIKALHDDENFLISEDGVRRRCRYSDFAVLLRLRSKISNYRAALEELGIASTAPKGRHFLETEEIALVTDYLKIVDNPLKDEEMLRVLMSPIYRFTAEEIAQLRLGTLGIDENALSEPQLRKIAKTCKDYSLYNCLRVCAKPLELAELAEDETGSIPRTVSKKLARFNADLASFRYCMSSNSLDDLIRRIYEDTDITAVVAAFEDSAQRVSNVRALQRLASDFAGRDGGDLSDFLRFLDRARENAKKGIEEASRAENSEDAVQIMTFHGSKGLEVPVCILAELQSQLNKSDFSGTLLVSRKHFLAMKHVDVRNRLKTTTLAYSALSGLNRRKMIGEELRLLYVAMTRAQEKLIMVGNISGGKLKDEQFDPDSPDALFDRSVPFKWVLGKLSTLAPDGAFSGKAPVDTVLEGVDCRIYETLADGKAPEPDAESRNKFDDITDEETAELVSLMNEQYPYAEEARQQAKFTVTELAHKKSVRPVNLIKPDFANNGKPTGAEKGNAYHHAMQYFPLERLAGGDILGTVKSAIAELAERGKITRREAGIVEPEHIAKFFQSEIGQRMLRSSEIVRERAFYSEIAGTEIGQEYGGRISVQGQIDLYFVEDDGIVVVDYKSDTAANLEEERENYAQQVKIYGRLLPERTGKPIKEMYLYAFLADKAIKI